MFIRTEPVWLIQGYQAQMGHLHDPVQVTPEGGATCHLMFVFRVFHGTCTCKITCL